VGSEGGLLFFFPDHQHIEIIVKSQVSVFIDKAVCASFLGNIQVSEVVEIEPEVRQLFLVHRDFIFRNQLHQNPSVLFQNAVDVPDCFAAVAVKPVVVIVAALIVTEFFIGPALNRFSAIETCFYHI
jgi:hypothetical protein